MAAILGEDEMTGEDVLQEMIGDGTDPTLHIPGRVGTPLSLFRAFLLEKDVHPTVETTYSSEELDGLLTRFYTEMKRVGGQHYADGTVSSIRSCLQKHFLRLRNEDIIQDEKYSTSNKMYEKIVSQSRKREMRNPKEKVPIQAIEPDDVDKLYNTVFSTDSPRMLQQKTLFEYIYYFCHRGLKHLRCVQKEDFAFHRDASGREYVTVREKNDKPGKILMQPVRMYDRPGDPMCPVASLKKYLMKLSPENPFFWQRPRKICYHSDAVWYKNSALGKNALSALMMNLSIEASLSKRYSNSNIRASNIPRLDNQSWEASVTPTVIGCETDQSAHRSPYPDCQDYFVISVERDPPYETDPGHQDSCENCDNERDTCTPIETGLGQQESCSDNKTDTTRRNKYRNVLFGAAANAWKQLIGRFDWLHDSEIAQHLIQVHEVHCMSKGICPLVRPPDTQNSDFINRTRKSGEVPILELKEEEEDISLQYEVEEADSVDEDSSDESDLEMGEVSDLEMGEEIALKDEPVYSMDNAPPNPGSTQQADNSVSHRNQEAAISWGANPFQASTVVNPNSAENYSNTENSTVTNMTSSSLYKPTGVKQEPFDNFTVNNTGTNDLIMRSAFTSPNVYESSSTHFANAVGIPEVIGQKAANKETRINVAQKPLIAAMLTNFGTVEASQVQRSQPLGLNSAHCINNVVPQNDLLTSGQRGSTWNIKRENTPNSVVVHSQDPELFQPVSVSAVGVHQISPEADEGGQQISPEADVRGQQISPESDVQGQQISLEADVRGQQISPEAYVRGHQISPEADEGGQQISPEADVRGQQISPEAYVRGQQISPEADEGGQQTGGKKSRNKKRKRLQGPYMLWVNTNRDKIMKHYPELDFQGFGRLAGAMWKAMDKTEWNKKFAEEKKKLNESRAKQLEERRRRAAIKRRKKLSEVSSQSVLARPQDSELFQSVSASAVGVQQISPKADAGGKKISPKSSARRKKISSEADVGRKKISTEAGARRKKISPKSGVLKKKEKQTSSGSVRQTGHQQENSGQKQKRKLQRPQSSYMLWINANREKIRKQHPGLDFGSFGRLVGAMWRAMDKTEWNKKSAEEWEEHNRAVKANRAETGKKTRAAYKRKRAEERMRIKAANKLKNNSSEICSESVSALKYKKIPKIPSNSAGSYQTKYATRLSSAISAAYPSSVSSSSTFPSSASSTFPSSSSSTFSSSSSATFPSSSSSSPSTAFPSSSSSSSSLTFPSSSSTAYSSSSSRFQSSSSSSSTFPSSYSSSIEAFAFSSSSSTFPSSSSSSFPSSEAAASFLSGSSSVFSA